MRRSQSNAATVDAREDQALRVCVASSLAGMPRAWRRALLLRYVDGLAGAELARAVGRPQEEVDRLLDHARAYFRERLLESGCATEKAREGTIDGRHIYPAD